MGDPIPLNQAKRRQRQAGGAPPEPPPDDGARDPCPLTALGHADGKFWFMNVVGERRGLSARQLGARPEIAALFLGDMTWLQNNFKALDQDGRPAGFKVAKATEHLMSLCRRQGIYGDHVVIRRPGVWPGEAGAPIAHCGDALFIAGEKHEPGVKIAGQIFAAAAREPYPAPVPAAATVARHYQGQIAALWNFRDECAEIMILGLVGAAYLAAALSWRPNGFISGASNAGKSHLLDLMRALMPLSHYSTDTTKAGIEGAVNGRALPSFIDEAADRVDQRGADMLLDIVLSASSGAGTKGHRGTAEGGVRSIELVGSVIMASVSPPAMQPQHRSRFVMIELEKPAPGADHNAEMKAIIASAKLEGPALFARALAGFARYQATLAVFRSALGAAGCVAREMDQIGSILAGWSLLVDDAPPPADSAAETVRLISGFIRGAEQMAEEDAPQRVLAILLSKLVQLDRSSDQDSLGGLIRTAMKGDLDSDANRAQAVKVLERWGIRPIRDIDVEDRAGRLIPRDTFGNGLWIDKRVEGLRAIFNGTIYAGDRWFIEIMRLPSTRISRKSVRVSSLPPGKALWISWDDLNTPDSDDTG